MTDPAATPSGERSDILQMLAKHRHFLRLTAQGLTDEQARTRTTVSALSVGGLIKHVSATEAQWADFIVNGGSAFGSADWASDDSADSSPEDSEGAGDRAPSSTGDDASEGTDEAAGGWDPAAVEQFMNGFKLLPEETLAEALSAYEAVAARTDELVRTLPDLDASHPLPPAPWFEPGAAWSVRRVFLHIIAETAQHAGHGDIIREGIDGQLSMG